MKNLLALFLIVTITVTAALQPLALRAETPRGAQPAGKTQQQHPSPEEVPEGLSKSDWAGIRAAYEAGRHAFAPTDTGWKARNPGQQWITTFDKRGFVAEPGHGEWTWGLELKGYGFAGAQRAIGGAPDVRAEGQRLTYGWDGTVEEWFVNDTRGLEHGFTVKERPKGAEASPVSSPLCFTLAVRGSLSAKVAADGRDVAFRDAEGATVLTYAGLKVWDAEGKELAARFAPVEDAAPGTLRLEVEESGARYPLTIDPIAQQAYLKASNTNAGDRFGDSVAVSGDTVVVGASNEDSSATGVDGDQSNNSASRSGAAYVFVRSGTTWTQQAYLKASNTGANDLFGLSVAVSGDTVVVGANGEDSNATGVDGNQADNSANGSGAAYVFTRNGTAWTQQAYLKASNTEGGDEFGQSVAVSGDTVVVGALQEDSNAIGVDGDEADNSAPDSGAAYVFTRSGTAWTQQAYLKASNTGAGDFFGDSVAVSGDTVVVGAGGEDSSATGVNGNQADNSASSSGAAYVFTRSGTTWTQQAYLKASNTGNSDFFGASVAVSGDTVVVGANGEDSNATGVDGNQADNSTDNSGAAYVFTRSGTTWTQQAYLKASNTGGGDLFGLSVAVSGDTVVVGASQEDSSATGVDGNQADNSAFGSGAAYVFTRSGTTWTQEAYLKASNTGADDFFGRSVAVSGDTVVVGAFGEASNATGVNGDQANNDAGSSGAAYVFLVPVTTLSPASNTIGRAGGTYDITVTSNTDWTAASDTPFATVSPASGSGNGTVTVTVAANAGAARAATITIGENSHMLSQEAGSDPDLNGDAFTDGLFQGPDGDLVILELKGSTAFTSDDVKTLTGDTSGYEVVGAADMNKDGFTDVLLQGPDGDVVILELKGATEFSSGDFQTLVSETFGYEVAGAADMNKDGCTDVLFEGPDGDVVILELKGTTEFTSDDVKTLVSDTFGYEVAGTGDMNKDGCTDVLFQGPGGDVVILELKGTTDFTSDDVKTLVSDTSGYEAVGAADMNKDNCADVLFAGPGGDIVVLFLKGTLDFTLPDDVQTLVPSTDGFNLVAP